MRLRIKKHVPLDLGGVSSGLVFAQYFDSPRALAIVGWFPYTSDCSAISRARDVKIAVSSIKEGH